ncbi:ATP-binding protein, partial [Streptomyces asiaticus]
MTPTSDRRNRPPSACRTTSYSPPRRPRRAAGPDAHEGPAAVSPRGRGIGLALVRRLAERYGGMARVTARAGGGAVFTVVLPEALTGDDTPTHEFTAAGESR